jgi:hypothetical protein
LYREDPEDVAMEAPCWFCSQSIHPDQATITPPSLGIPVHRECFRADTGQNPVEPKHFGTDADDPEEPKFNDF